MTAEEIIQQIEEGVEDAMADHPELSRDEVMRSVAESILLDVQSRALRAQVRRRLGISIRI